VKASDSKSSKLKHRRDDNSPYQYCSHHVPTSKYQRVVYSLFTSMSFCILYYSRLKESPHSSKCLLQKNSTLNAQGMIVHAWYRISYWMSCSFLLLVLEQWRKNLSNWTSSQRERKSDHKPIVIYALNLCNCLFPTAILSP